MVHVHRRTGPVLEVGHTGRFEGTYYLHWEWTRFEPMSRSRWRRCRVRCELLSAPVPWPAPIHRFMAVGGRAAGARFAITVDADVVAHAQIGHRGILHWQLSVHRWIAVEPCHDEGPPA